MIKLPNFTGISGKSQVLFALVFATRYLDLFTNFISAYNSVMKVSRWSFFIFVMTDTDWISLMSYALILFFHYRLSTFPAHLPLFIWSILNSKQRTMEIMILSDLNFLSYLLEVSHFWWTMSFHRLRYFNKFSILIVEHKIFLPFIINRMALQFSGETNKTYHSS